MNSIDALLRLATEEKNKQNYLAACQFLQSAFVKIKETPICYPVETYLRLPNYLHMSGNVDEAWMQYELLLSSGYPNQINDPGLIAYDKSTILDKMRLFQCREKDYITSAIYGIASHILKRESLQLQKRHNEVDFLDSPAGKSILIKSISAHNNIKLSEDILFVELSNITSKMYHNDISSLLSQLKVIISRCVINAETKCNSNDKSFTDIINSFWLLCPDTKAFKGLIINYRKLISSKIKSKYDIDGDLHSYYKIAVLHELLFETNLIPFTSKLNNIKPVTYQHVSFHIAKSLDCYSLYKILDPDYQAIGYNSLSILTKTDINLLLRFYGEPKSHIKPRIYFLTLWNEIIDKYENAIIENHNNFITEFNQLIKDLQ